MALILLEGLDRTGKSTVAAYYRSLGYEVVHLSAPPKGTTTDQYLQEMIDLISSAATRDIVMDRTHYGECVWPEVYGRKPLLGDDEFEVLREIEEAVGIQRILMTDPNYDAHWQRCVDNKEPLTKQQFVKARAIYSQMAHKYGFEIVTLPKFVEAYPDAKDYVNLEPNKTTTVIVSGPNEKGETTTQVVDPNGKPNDTTAAKYPGKTPEQIKLERANAINEILSKRILKPKGSMYDDLENDIRDFLNNKLGTLLGGGKTVNELSLSPSEIRFYKAMYKKALENKGEI